MRLLSLLLILCLLILTDGRKRRVKESKEKCTWDNFYSSKKIDASPHLVDLIEEALQVKLNDDDQITKIELFHTNPNWSYAIMDIREVTKMAHQNRFLQVRIDDNEYHSAYEIDETEYNSWYHYCRTKRKKSDDKGDKDCGGGDKKGGKKGKKNCVTGKKTKGEEKEEDHNKGKSAAPKPPKKPCTEKKTVERKSKKEK
ncbi:hypothetical protein Aduo_007956 [Ancylostoma duodenale]